MRRLSLSTLPLLACSLNPAYDPSSTTTATNSTGPAPPTTGGDATLAPDPTTTGPSASTSTSSPLESTGPAATGTTVAVDSTGDEPSTTTTTTADTTTADTDAPPDCWDLDPASWNAPPILLDDFADVDPIDPDISDDGLALVYIAGSDRRPFRSTRDARTDPFPNGKQIALWAGAPDIEPGYPHLSLADEEMVLGFEGDVYFARFMPGDINEQYDEPELFPGAINTPMQETPLTITTDGTTLVTTRLIDPDAPFPYDFHFIQLTRDDPEPGDEFFDPVDVTPDVPPHGFALCPTLSPDGLRLFFSSTTSPDFNEVNAADVIHIFTTTRPARDAPWQPAVQLDAFAPGGGVLCPASVTADGCGLAYSKFPFGLAVMPYTMYLRERSP